MNSLIKVALCALMPIFAASCSGKKDWTCVCNTDAVPRSNVYQYEDMKKKDAQKECDTNDKTYGTPGGGTVTESCGLE